MYVKGIYHGSNAAAKESKTSIKFKQRLVENGQQNKIKSGVIAITE